MNIYVLFVIYRPLYLLLCFLRWIFIPLLRRQRCHLAVMPRIFYYCLIAFRIYRSIRSIASRRTQPHTATHQIASLHLAGNDSTLAVSIIQLFYFYFYFFSLPFVVFDSRYLVAFIVRVDRMHTRITWYECARVLLTSRFYLNAKH